MLGFIALFPNKIYFQIVIEMYIVLLQLTKDSFEFRKQVDVKVQHWFCKARVGVTLCTLAQQCVVTGI